MKKMILSYLRWAAKARLSRLKPTIVGVTGSVGKSTFVELLDHVTTKSFSVKSTSHGNSESGLPLEILGLRHELTNYQPITWLKVLTKVPRAILRGPAYDLLIAEMDADEPTPPRNLSYLLSFIKPDIGVWLTVAPCHTQQFAQVVKNPEDENEILQAIATEIGKLVTTLPANKTAVINTGNPFIAQRQQDIVAKIITAGEQRGADWRISRHTVSLNAGTTFEIMMSGEKWTVQFANNILGPEIGSTVAMVMATALELGIDKETIINRLQSAEFPPGRSSLLPGIKNSFLIDSSYNSSPAAIASMLTAIKKIDAKGRKIVVLGDMRELGPLEPESHRSLGSQVAKVADVAILVGEAVRSYTLPALLKAGFPAAAIHHFRTSQEAGRFIKKQIVKRHDLVLIKGSQNTIFLEEVVAQLLANPEDTIKLARQDNYWQKIRDHFFASIS